MWKTSDVIQNTENAAPAATRRPITSYDESDQLNVEEQPDQTDNGLSVEEEWNLLSTEVPDEKNVDDGDGDGDDNVIDANLLVGAQCAVVFVLLFLKQRIPLLSGEEKVELPISEMNGYRLGLTSAVLEYAVKKFCHHSAENYFYLFK